MSNIEFWFVEFLLIKNTQRFYLVVKMKIKKQQKKSTKAGATTQDMTQRNNILCNKEPCDVLQGIRTFQKFSAF